MSFTGKLGKGKAWNNFFYLFTALLSLGPPAKQKVFFVKNIFPGVGFLSNSFAGGLIFAKSFRLAGQGFDHVKEVLGQGGEHKTTDMVEQFINTKGIGN